MPSHNQNTLSISRLLIMLAAMVALAPFAIDTYLPAMLGIADDFTVSVHDVELTLSLFLGGFAAGQIIGGPFSDHFGRRFSTLTGLSLFIVGTLGITLSTNIQMMWLLRVVQAIGGGLVVVNSPAVIRDISSGHDSARYLSRMAVIMMMAPLLAPMIGTLILQVGSWRAIFVFLLVYSLLILLATSTRLPETRIPHPERPSVLSRYLDVFTHRRALAYIFSQSFSYGGMFAFITGSAAVYMGYFEVSKNVYPFLFGANVVTMVLSNRLNLKLLHHFAPKNLLSLGQAIQVVAGLLLVGYTALSDQPQLTVYVILVVVFIGMQGLIVANATASTIEFFPHNSATATALLGALGFITGSVSGTMVGVLGDGSALPMAEVMLVCAIAGPVMRLTFTGGHKS